jgi:hypothetical protein
MGKFMGMGLGISVCTLYLYSSRQSITAKPPAITNPSVLTHIGMTIALTITSQPKERRKKWTKLTKANTTMAMIVKGFMLRLLIL